VARESAPTTTLGDAALDVVGRVADFGADLVGELEAVLAGLEASGAAADGGGVAVGALVVEREDLVGHRAAVDAGQPDERPVGVEAGPQFELVREVEVARRVEREGEVEGAADAVGPPNVWVCPPNAPEAEMPVSARLDRCVTKPSPTFPAGGMGGLSIFAVTAASQGAKSGACAESTSFRKSVWSSGSSNSSPSCARMVRDCELYVTGPPATHAADPSRAKPATTPVPRR
jgi:hypothetical protein